MSETPRVSIVVATYNRCDGLRTLLRSLAEQTHPADDFEVVVVDDGSTDGTQQLLRTIEVPYTLRSVSQQNCGPAVARNRGVGLATGDLIVFLDDDVVPVPWLIAAHLETHGAADDLVVTGPMSPPPPDWHQPAWDRWDAIQLQKQYQAMLTGRFPCSQRQFFTANASLRRPLFQSVGGFDPVFRRAEDMELAWRLSRHGARFAFNPQADVEHFAARPFVSWRRNAYQYGRYDVIMDREKAIPVFGIACREFYTRRKLNQLLARRCVGRPIVHNLMVRGLTIVTRVSTLVGAERIAMVALSSIFNLQYWQGAADELGGPAQLWQMIESPETAQAIERSGPATAPSIDDTDRAPMPAVEPVLAGAHHSAPEGGRRD